MSMADSAEKELTDLMEELDMLLKNPEVVALLTARGVNSSLALLIADALGSYVRGDKKEAAEDLGTAAEEISARLLAPTPVHEA
jgi:hypothetical protein